MRRRHSSAFLRLVTGALLPAGALAAGVFSLLAPLAGCAGGDDSGSSPAAVEAGAFDSGAVVPPGDAGSASEAAAPSDAASDVQRASACTAPPFVVFSANVNALGQAGSGSPAPATPLAGASVSFTTCAGFVVTSDAKGFASTQLTAGIAVSPFYSAFGYLGVIGAEVSAASDAYASVDLLPKGPPPFTGYDASKATLHLVLSARAAAPCDQVDGVTLQVAGHPEAVAHYMMPDWPASTAETSSGVSVGKDVFFSGLTGAQKVTVAGTKAGCQVVASGVAQTGSFVLSNGLVTAGTVSLGRAVN